MQKSIAETGANREAENQHVETKALLVCFSFGFRPLELIIDMLKSKK